MGIYKPMMALLADPIHQFKKQIGFFWPIAIGMLVGTLGISKLLVGMDAREAISRMRGIRCGFKPTSCPDQLAQALKTVL